MTRLYLHGNVNMSFSISGEDLIAYTKSEAEDMSILIEMETGEKLLVVHFRTQVGAWG